MDNNAVKWAELFQALGSRQRLSVYLTLLEYSPNGLNLKTLQEKLDMKPSTLAHHIKFLTDAQFIQQKRKSKEIYNYANDSTLRDLCTNVIDTCCTKQ